MYSLEFASNHIDWVWGENVLFARMPLCAITIILEDGRCWCQPFSLLVVWAADFFRFTIYCFFVVLTQNSFKTNLSGLALAEATIVWLKSLIPLSSKLDWRSVHSFRTNQLASTLISLLRVFNLCFFSGFNLFLQAVANPPWRDC